MEDAFILQANIVRFRDLLATRTDPAQRRTIERLLGDAIYGLKRLGGGYEHPATARAIIGDTSLIDRADAAINEARRLRLESYVQQQTTQRACARSTLSCLPGTALSAGIAEVIRRGPGDKRPTAVAPKSFQLGNNPVGTVQYGAGLRT
jgi:hypothetical protein